MTDRVKKNKSWLRSNELSTMLLEKNPCADPVVSIVIPTYRRAELLKEAIKSALMQDVQEPIEIVVVDNDPESSVSVLEVIQDLSFNHCLRYFKNISNLGMEGNWNQCIYLARGRWITFLHDDDWISEKFISMMLPIVKSNCNVAVCKVISGFDSYNTSILSNYSCSRDLRLVTRDDLILGNITPSPGALVLRELYIEMGGFDSTAYPCSDYLFYIKCVANNKILRLDCVLAYYRKADSQTLKGDTLSKMIKMANQINVDYLRESGSFLSVLTHVLAMSYWLKLARSKNIVLSGMSGNGYLKVASIVSLSAVGVYFLFFLRKMLKIIFRY